MLFAEFAWSRETRLDSVAVTVDIENNIAMLGSSGLYLMACPGGRIGDTGFYFGLQTNIQRISYGLIGKGAIFSRWYDNNEPAPVRLSDTRIPEEGWTESGDYEGNFVSVRSLYPWTQGAYTLEVIGAEVDARGRWFEYWVDDGDTRTWVGSLRFPLTDGTARIKPWCPTTIEVYGRPVAPEDIPYWNIYVSAPLGDGVPSRLWRTCYPGNVANLRNVEVAETAQGALMTVGLDYIAHDSDPDRQC